MKVKKILASVLALSLSAAVFAGCGTDTGTEVSETTSAESGEADGGSDTEASGAEENGAGNVEVPDTAALKEELAQLYGDETVQLTVYSQLANYSGKLTGWFAKILKDNFNCEVTIIPESDGTFDTRMASGNLGDIVIFGNDGEQYKRAVESGMLFEWNDENLLDEYGAYIKANMPYALEKNYDINEGVTGGIELYGFGHDVATSPEDHQEFMYSWDTRWDLYDQLGRPDVKTLDDYMELALEMKKICPTDENGNPTYAYSIWPDWDGNMVMFVKAFAMAYWGYDEFEMGLYDVESGEFFFALDEDGPYLQSLKFFNKLYQNNLIDPNSMTQTYNEATEKVTAGGTFFALFNYAGSMFYNTEEHIADNKMMLPLRPDDASPLAYGMNIRGSNRIWSIGKGTEYPELCMAIINYLSTPEGFMTYKYGPKDVCWYYNENDQPCFTELGEKTYTNPEEIMPDEWGGGMFKDGLFAANNTTWAIDAKNPETDGEKYNPVTWASRQTDARCDIEQAWRDYTGCVLADEYLDSGNYKIAVGGASYSAAAQSDELKIVWEQVKNCIVNNSWKAMYAATDEEYDKIVADMIAQYKEYDPNGECRAWCVEQAAVRHEAEPAVGEK